MYNFLFFNSIERCEQGWAMFKNGCYKFNLEEKDWDEAENTCNQENGHLTSVLSNEEVNFIRCLQDPAAIHKTWIGAKRIGNGFEWSDGKGFEFENWRTGQPNNQGGQENCIEVDSDPGQSSHDQWNDVPCSNKRNFVCKKNPVGGMQSVNVYLRSISTTIVP